MDNDLKHPLLYQIEVNNEGECGFVSVEYENILNFCTTCSSIRHPATRKLNQPKEDKDVHAKLIKLARKKTVFKEDSDNEDFDKDDLEKIGDNGNAKKTSEADCDEGSLRKGDSDHSGHVHGQQGHDV